MKFIICDDEPSQLEILHQYIDRYAKEHRYDIEVLEYTSCDNLWWDLQSGLYAELLLLDIQMTARKDIPAAAHEGSRKHSELRTSAPMSGMELAHRMRDHKMFHRICFVSGIREYVFEGYEVEAAGYILKPYTEEQLYRIFDKTISVMSEEAEYSIVESGRETYKIFHQDVVGLEASLRETIVYLKRSQVNTQAQITLRKSITECMELLKMDSLMKVQRSYAVNLKNIVRVTKEGCVGEDGTLFPIARGQRDAVMRAFIKANNPRAAIGKE